MALASSLLLLIAIAVMRVRLLRRLARERELEARWYPLLAQCAIELPAELLPLTRRDAESVLVLWCRAQESVRGDAQLRLAELGRRVGIEPHAERLFDDKGARRKHLGTIALGHLRSRRRLRDMEALLPDAPPAIALSAAQALLRIDAQRALPLLLGCAAQRDDWPLATVASILKEVDAAAVAARLAAGIRAELAHPRAGGALARLIRLHATAQAETLRPAIAEVLQRCEDPEALVAALAAVIHPEDLAHVRRLLEHEHTAVRVAAARALGRLGERGDFARLAARLADASWWVRHRAAQALCSLPGVGRAELEALSRALGDRFAADALRQALAEHRA